jgi:polar amino acid transport system permease protein
MVLTAFCGFLLYQAAVKLEYHWNWGVIPQFILRHDPTTGTWHAGTLLLGLFMTLRLSLWGSVLALSFGIIFGLLRISNHLYWRLIAGTYVGLVRNTPPLVIVFVFYFFIGDQIMNAFSVNTFAYGLAAGDHPLFALLFGPTDQLPQILSAIITIGLFEGAYIAEIVRAGIESIEQGQWEASCSLGFNRNQQLRHVILPQALQRMIPALAGQFISTIKDSAIVAVISIQELTFQGLQLMTTTYRTFEIWITVLCMYFILTFMCSLILHRLEHNFARN